MKKKIVLTGITGFVGSNLARFLLNNNYDVSAIIREHSDISILDDIKDQINFLIYDQDIKKLIAFFKETEPTCVFHLASNFIAEHNSSQIDSLISSNITFGLHLLEAMKEAGVQRLLNTGTSWQHYNNESYNPVCLYAATKQAFESLIEYYVQAEDFKVITLKLFDTYGETDTRPKLINLLNKFADENTELYMTPGEQILNLVHISDVCNAYDTAFKMVINQHKENHSSYAIAHPNSYQLKEVINIFETISNKKINVVWGGKNYRKREVMKLWDKGRKMPNWEAKITLEEGLRRIILNH